MANRSIQWSFSPGAWLLLWMERPGAVGAAERSAVEVAASACGRVIGQIRQWSSAIGKWLWAGSPPAVHAEGDHFTFAKGWPRVGTQLLDPVQLRNFWHSGKASIVSGHWLLGWSVPKERQFVLCTDPLAAEPLYWRRLPQGWALGNSPYWLAQLAPPAALDLDSLHDFLLWGHRDQGEYTFWQGVRALPGGHCACFAVGDKEPQLTMWWQAPQKLDTHNHTEAPSAQLHTLMDVALATGLSNVTQPVSLLSGGLDSSALSAWAYRYAPHLQAVSTHWPEQPFDEFTFACKVADYLRLKLHAVQPQVEELLAASAHLMQVHEGPVMSPGAFAQYQLMGRAAELGADIVIDGTAADALFAGHTSHLVYWGAHCLRTFHWREAAYVAASCGGWGAFFSAFAKMVGKNWLFRHGRQQWMARRLLRQLYEEWSVFAPEFLRKHGREAPVGYWQWGESLEEVLRREYYEGEVTFLLRSLHRNAEAHGLRVFAPFAHEPAVATWALALPARWKIRAGWTKWVLRKAVTDLLPEAVVWRHDKLAQATPANLWTRALLRELWPVLEANPLGLFDRRALQRLRHTFFEPRGPIERYRVFKFAAFAAWWQMLNSR